MPPMPRGAGAGAHAERTIGGRAPAAPKSRSSDYGFLDMDDPDAERVIRQHAAATGQDPDEAVRGEVARRASNGRSGSLDDVLEGERAKSARNSPASSPTGAKAPGSSPKSSRKSSPKSSTVGAPSLTPPSRWSSADGAGFLLGLMLYALGLNVIRYGPKGASAWLAAKFLNKPATSMTGAGGQVSA